MASKLLQNGTVLSFDDTTQSIKVLRNASILITGDEITALGENVEAPANTEVVDMTGKILTPGFINTHSHVWQTAYRTLAPNTTLAEYMYCFSQLSPSIKSFSAEDVYISSMEGYYEGLNGGVTTFLDHAHNNWEPDAVKRGWDAAVDGGARVYWCPNVEDRDNCSAKQQLEFMSTLGNRSKTNHPLVSIGLAYDSFGASTSEDTEKMKSNIKKLNLEAITMHHVGRPWPLPPDLPVAASKAKLQDLNIPIVFSHVGFVTDDEKDALRRNDWNVSITPESEMHYGHGQETSRFIHDQASLGIDTNWTFSGDILTQSRLWLQNVRGISYTKTLKTGFIPNKNPMAVEDAFLLATRQGGRAVRRDDLGVLKVGAQADIVVFDGDSPNMLGWTDPIAAVVLHANIGDIEHVLVGGEFRKRDRKLIMHNDSWSQFSEKFARMARRIQNENKDLPTLPEKFFGVGEYSDVEIMSCKINK